MVLVTSVGAGDSKEAIPAAVYDTLKSALVDKTKAENLCAFFVAYAAFESERASARARVVVRESERGSHGENAKTDV